MAPNFFPAYSVFLTILLVVAVPRVVCQDDQLFVSCGAEYECGNTSMKIGYPFWGGNRPEYCGHPGFELDCDGEAPEFAMDGLSYRVLDINDSTDTVTVARADYWDSNCPDKYVNTTLNATLFSYNSTTSHSELTIYYKCPPAVSIYNQFNCSNNNITGYFTVRDLISLSSVISGSCGVNVKIPIFESAANATVSGGGIVNGLREALKEGFGLSWNASNSLCKECVESGGHCGYNNSQVVCFCRDGPSSASTCGNPTTSSPGMSMYMYIETTSFIR